MSRRRILIGIIVAMLVALVVSGTTLAVGSPHATAAKKHHKKKHHKKKHKKAKCTGTTSGASQLTANGTAQYSLGFICTKPFSQFTVMTNKSMQAVTSASAYVTNKLGPVGVGRCSPNTRPTNTLTCSQPHMTSVGISWKSTEVCLTPLKLTTTATVNGKVYTLTASYK